MVVNSTYTETLRWLEKQPSRMDRYPPEQRNRIQALLAHLRVGSLMMSNVLSEEVRQVIPYTYSDTLADDLSMEQVVDVLSKIERVCGIRFLPS